MPTVQLNAELSFEQLANAVAQLPQAEFQKLLRQTNKVYPLHEKHRVSARESSLLIKINQGLPATTQQRFDELIGKRDARTLTPVEHEELLNITDEIECLDAKRMEYILELAQLREQALSFILEELGIAQATNG